MAKVTIQRAIWDFLVANGPLSTRDLARRLGLSPGRVSRALERLLAVPAIRREGWSADARYVAIVAAQPCAKERSIANLTDEGRRKGVRISAERAKQRARKQDRPASKQPIQHPIVRVTHPLDVAWGLARIQRDGDS